MSRKTYVRTFLVVAILLIASALYSLPFMYRNQEWLKNWSQSLRYPEEMKQKEALC